ncbi:hypothetical protein K438DRAFT_1797132 [Mycena galopus ATCC 62051]|nr:hypothetical protein K438DRAFT_1797132 [Mycena galopus ATCC 62051]
MNTSVHARVSLCLQRPCLPPANSRPVYSQIHLKSPQMNSFSALRPLRNPAAPFHAQAILGDYSVPLLRFLRLGQRPQRRTESFLQLTESLPQHTRRGNSTLPRMTVFCAREQKAYLQRTPVAVCLVAPGAYEFHEAPRLYPTALYLVHLLSVSKTRCAHSWCFYSVLTLALSGDTISLSSIGDQAVRTLSEFSSNKNLWATPRR